MEQELIEDLVIESIKIHGVDVWYMKRTTGAKDELLNEDDLPIYEDAYLVDMYIRSVDGFEGEGDFLSKFGLQIRDSMTLSIAIRTFNLEVGLHTEQNRPNEGDLIYFPLNNKMFEVMHVEHEAIFYQMGQLQMYDLRCELFEYSGERFDTGQDFIDNLYDALPVVVPAGDVEFDVKIEPKTVDHVYYGEGANTAFILSDLDQPQFFNEAPQLEFYTGVTYVFDQSDASNADTRLTINTGETRALGAELTSAQGLIKSGTPGANNAVTTWTPTSIGDYYYIHLDGSNGDKEYMGNKIVVVESPLDNIENFDTAADNTTIESEADNILDFSELNPFGEDDF